MNPFNIRFRNAKKSSSKKIAISKNVEQKPRFLNLTILESVIDHVFLLENHEV
jgi:hypothetical protein